MIHIVHERPVLRFRRSVKRIFAVRVMIVLLGDRSLDRSPVARLLTQSLDRSIVQQFAPSLDRSLERSSVAIFEHFYVYVGARQGERRV